MKHLLLLSLSFGLLLNAQNTILLGNKIINPSFISLIDTTVFYSKLNNINREIGLFESEIGAIYKIKNNYFHSSVYQYGYKHYKETIVKTASSKQISKNVFFGRNTYVFLACSAFYFVESSRRNKIINYDILIKKITVLFHQYYIPQYPRL